ncbi:hypothetical protein P0136_10600 [Lentisphaerota bacterium ZTH]|nr:hypothetical protein JYG24_11885 [Lentisphaerota bacterium]WET05810.1 hypothetical protein P0136_10600 [Lentisphaerota bacterium ZTH]
MKDKRTINFVTTIYGDIIMIGGKSPNIHIEPLGGGKLIVCDMDKSEVEKLGHMLYKRIGINGIATKEGGKIVRMKVQRILNYSQDSKIKFIDIDKANNLKKTIGDRTMAEYLKDIRGRR